LKLLIVGNSGSGKSTLSKMLSEALNSEAFDLDCVAFENKTSKRNAIDQSKQEIANWLECKERWIVEGCYADLHALFLNEADILIYLDISTEQCQANARTRPWEPHKYESKEAQDANLEMLLRWIASYENDDGATSKSAHENLFEHFSARKYRVNNIDAFPELVSEICNYQDFFTLSDHA
jgi:adenylate kinase family enzyme